MAAGARLAPRLWGQAGWKRPSCQKKWPSRKFRMIWECECTRALSFSIHFAQLDPCYNSKWKEIKGKAYFQPVNSDPWLSASRYPLPKKTQVRSLPQSDLLNKLQIFIKLCKTLYDKWDRTKKRKKMGLWFSNLVMDKSYKSPKKRVIGAPMFKKSCHASSVRYFLTLKQL